MTTTEAKLVKNVQEAIVSPSMFNVQYPNCQRGMFSLRQPFQKVVTDSLPAREDPLPRDDFIEAPRQPTKSVARLTPIKDERPIEKPVYTAPRKLSKRNAEIQCMLLKPTIHHDAAVQTKFSRERSEENYFDRNSETNSQQMQMQPVGHSQNYYEVRDVEPIFLHPINHRREQNAVQYVKAQKAILVYDDEDSDKWSSDTERIIYAREPRQKVMKTYLPPNVRMICVRDDTKKNS